MGNSKKGSIRNQFIAVLTVNIITFNQGSAIGWVSPALPVLLGDESPLGSPLTDSQASLIASMFCIGAMVGTLSYGWLLDILGRKKAALSTALPFIICWSLKLFCTNPYAIIVGRFIVGFGSAGMLLVAPIYSTELATAENRGILGTMLTLTFNLGILFVYVVGEYFSYKTVLILMLSIPILFLFLMMKMPESPPYLVKLEQYQEAANAIAWFRQLPSNSEIVQKEVEKLRCEMNLSGSGNKENARKEISPVRFLMKSTPSMKTLSVTASLLGLQSLLGMFAVLSYSSEIFRNAGSTLSPGLSSILVGLLQLFGSLIASVFIERLGRKVLLISSTFIVSFSMASLGTYFYVRDSGYDVSAFGLVPVIFLCLTVFAFAIGIGPIPFILPSEMFLMQVRGLATSLSLVMMWNSTFLVAQFFRSIVTAYGNHVAFWGFACNGCMVIFLCIFFLPETKGKSLEDIVEFFGGRKDLVKLQNEEVGVPLKNMSDFDNKLNDQETHYKHCMFLSIPILFLFLMMKMPESPPYLVKLEQYQEAANAIAWFRQLPSNSEIVQKEVEKLRCEMNLSGSGNKENARKEISPVRFLMKSTPSMKTLSVTASLLGLQSLLGMFAVLSYSSEIFRNAGSTLSPGLSSILVGLLQLFGSLIASVFIERLGRKVLLISSTFIVSFSMASLGTYFYVRDSGYDVSAFGLVPVIFLCLTVFAFAIGIGPIPFILPSEMFLMQVRGLATSLSLVMMWNSTFLVAQFFRSIVTAYGNHVAFWGFACNGCMVIFLCIFFLPETKGKSLEDIVEFFGGRKDLVKLQNEEVGVPLKNMSDFDNKLNDQETH